jgi:hypothetical protein
MITDHVPYPDEPNGIGTLMTWALAQALVPGTACQMVSWVL